MNESIRARLARLEAKAVERAAACANCGASWPGHVYASIEEDDTVTPRCIRCNTAVPDACGPMKAYAAGLMEGLWADAVAKV